MDLVKKFFDKKKSDTKFNKAGHGKKLTDVRNLPSSNQRKAAPVRTDPSAGARKAGAAALDRFSSNRSNVEVDWAAQAIKARLRRELESEKKLQGLSLQEQNVAAAAVTAAAATETQMEQHVMFSCPSLGLDIGKYDTIKTGIRELLYSQLGEDKGVAACLIIHTCNKGIEKVSVCVDTLCKYVENIVRNAEEEKYRKIRQSNKAYQERVCCVEGALLFLEAAGFVEQELPFNDGTDKFWVFPTDGDVERLEGLSASLRCAEPLRPTLERSAVVLLPRQAAKVPQLPPEFYNISKEEMQREKQLRSEVVEQSIVLRTKAMRERQSQKDLRKYRFTLLRIRFPDGLTLQGTFRVAEKLSAVMQFVREYLVNDWRPFFLCPSAGKRFTSEDEDQGLSEHLLVPSAMLNFAWDLDVTDPGLDDSVMLAPHAYELISQDQLQDH